MEPVWHQARKIGSRYSSLLLRDSATGWILLLTDQKDYYERLPPLGCAKVIWSNSIKTTFKPLVAVKLTALMPQSVIFLLLLCLRDLTTTLAPMQDGRAVLNVSDPKRPWWSQHLYYDLSCPCWLGLNKALSRTKRTPLVASVALQLSSLRRSRPRYGCLKIDH